MPRPIVQRGSPAIDIRLFHPGSSCTQPGFLRDPNSVPSSWNHVYPILLAVTGHSQRLSDRYVIICRVGRRVNKFAGVTFGFVETEKYNKRRKVGKGDE